MNPCTALRPRESVITAVMFFAIHVALHNPQPDKGSMVGLNVGPGVRMIHGVRCALFVTLFAQGIKQSVNFFL
jgi:hypothetical protein